MYVFFESSQLEGIISQLIFWGTWSKSPSPSTIPSCMSFPPSFILCKNYIVSIPQLFFWGGQESSPSYILTISFYILSIIYVLKAHFVLKVPKFGSIAAVPYLHHFLIFLSSLRATQREYILLWNLKVFFWKTQSSSSSTYHFIVCNHQYSLRLRCVAQSSKFPSTVLLQWTSKAIHHSLSLSSILFQRGYFTLKASTFYFLILMSSLKGLSFIAILLSSPLLIVWVYFTLKFPSEFFLQCT